MPRSDRHTSEVVWAPSPRSARCCASVIRYAYAISNVVVSGPGSLRINERCGRTPPNRNKSLRKRILGRNNRAVDRSRMPNACICASAFLKHWDTSPAASGQPGVDGSESKPNSFATCGVSWKKRGATPPCFVDFTRIWDHQARSNCTTCR